MSDKRFFPKKHYYKCPFWNKNINSLYKVFKNIKK